ncbi:MAG: hypothetical protein ACE5G0_06345 [Rhodothermales bacterium]
MRMLPLGDPWKRFVSAVPLSVYGMGAQRDFCWYFEGKSVVEVRSIEEIQEWLLGCGYARDPDLFHEADFWQHPCTFEQLRKGDCEDFSLWAWRKMVRLGYDAEFVAGRSLHPGCQAVGHTWVLFRQDGRTYLFDTIMQDREEMIRPLEEVAHEYNPEVSVDGTLTRYVYAGYYLKWQGRKAAAKRQGIIAVARAG